ncbi:MAG: DNA alkylation repair protein [Nanoarchaeota archaeon]|nr:DNA alkylation repair protein [Nanoarchaeota archaeon]
MNCDAIIRKLKSMGSEKDRIGMARYGINVEKAFGVSIYKLRPFAKEIGKDHGLALELWKTGIHEARMLAVFIDDPAQVTESQMESWAKDFDSWDIVDQCVAHLFDRTLFAYKKAYEWAERDEEFIKRAGFVFMAALSVHDKKADDKQFEKFFPLIKKHCTDERNFVKKAVNWAVRQIGKRNKALNKKAIKLAKDIKKIDSKAARWIASDALRELESEKVQKRFK